MSARYGYNLLLEAYFKSENIDIWLNAMDLIADRDDYCVWVGR